MVKKILIVDDDATNRDLVIKSLRKETDLEIHEAKDGPEAVKLARELRPAVIVLDIMMPGMTGYEVCEELMHSETPLPSRILFLSARDSVLTRHTAKASGGAEFMAKPFSPRDLKEKIMNMLLQYKD